MARRIAHLAVISALALASSPRTARADSFTAPGRGHVETVAAEAIIAYDGRVETLIDDLAVMSNASASVWLRAFPTTPKEGTQVEASTFASLEDKTNVFEPENETMRSRLFGPSVVTLLTRKLAQPNLRARGGEPKLPETNRTLEIERLLYFTGRIETSTVTHRPQFPAELSHFLSSENVTLGQATESELANYLNRGWTIMAAAIRDPRPSDQVPARLGPMTWQFAAAPTAIYPFDFEHGASGSDRLFRFYLVAEGTLVPAAYETVWDDRPWEHAPQKGRFRTTFQREVGSGALEFEITERAGVHADPSWHLVRTEFLAQTADHHDLAFIPTKRPVTLPPSGQKGSGLDLFLCILLGLTPLLYTPESWFLLWLGGRARARVRAARNEKPVFGIKLWSLYALLVGAYWFFALEGGGRVAAIIPTLVGMIQIALPYAERDPSPIRAQIKKKKK